MEASPRRAVEIEIFLVFARIRKLCSIFSMTPTKRDCFISKLPTEILHEIFVLLPLDELVAADTRGSWKESDSDDILVPQIEILAKVSRQFRKVATGISCRIETSAISSWIETTDMIDTVILKSDYDDHRRTDFSESEIYIASKHRVPDPNSLFLNRG
jgi:hypothetical protein